MVTGLLERFSKRLPLKRSHDESEFSPNDISKEIKVTKNKLKKLEATELVNKKKKKLQEGEKIQKDIIELQNNITEQQLINQKMKRKLFEGKENIKLWKTKLEKKQEDDKLYKNLKKCIKGDKFDDGLQVDKREYPVCRTEPWPKKTSHLEDIF